MNLIKKIFAIFFLLFGVSFSAAIIGELLNPKASPKDKEGAVAALTIFTIPSTILGSGLSWSLMQQKRKEQALLVETEQKRLNLVFLELLEKNAGKITVLQMAKNAEISIQDAKQYLDTKAKELSASFEVNKEGNILYCFPL